MELLLDEELATVVEVDAALGRLAAQAATIEREPTRTMNH